MTTEEVYGINTIGACIQYLERGAGWYAPFKPRIAGKILKKISEEYGLADETAIKMEKYRGSEGDGPGFRYIHIFTIRFVELFVATTRMSGTAEDPMIRSIFGGKPPVKFTVGERAIVFDLST